MFGIDATICPPSDDPGTSTRANGQLLNATETKWSEDGMTATAVNISITETIVYDPPAAWIAKQSVVVTTVPTVKFAPTLVESGI